MLRREKMREGGRMGGGRGQKRGRKKGEERRMGGGRGQIRGREKRGREETGTSCTRLYVLYGKVGIWFDFCFTVLQHILGNFERSQLP